METQWCDIIHKSSYSSYVLQDSDTLSSMDLKVLAAQEDSQLLPCIPSKFNGRCKLTYLSDGAVPLSLCLVDLRIEQFVAITAGVLKTLVEVSNNGLLDSLKIDLSFEAIYIDTETCSVRMIYLPVTRHVSAETPVDQFNLICQELLRAMDEQPRLKKHARTMANLINASSGKLDTLYEQIAKSCPQDVGPIVSSFGVLEATSDSDSLLTPPKRSEKKDGSTEYLLSGNAAGVPVSFAVRPGSSILGKNRYQADFVIEHMPTISNRHCKLRLHHGVLAVEDLGSTNGTFVNGHRIARGGYTQLEDGDTLRVSTLTLMVRKAQ